MLLQQPEAAYINGVLTKPVIPSCLFDALLHGEIRGLPAVAEPQAQRFDGIRVLLVEDNELNQEVAANIIRKRGATLTIAWHGGEAVELVRRQAFDLVLMDLHMPVMGGIEAARRIRELKQGKHPPIVAMTAAVMAEDRELCRASGLVDFIPKPVEPEDIVRVLRTYTQPPAEIPTAAMPVAQKNLPVLDLVKGLNRLDGDRALQQRLLLGFIQCYQDLIPRLDLLLREGGGGDAIELIHAMKGVAANLGASALAEACSRLLEELRSAAPSASRAAFDGVLLDTLRQMQQQVGDYRPPERITAEADSPVPLPEALRLLEPFIIGQEVAPDSLLLVLRQLAEADSPYSSLLRKLQVHLENFEHPEALATLNLLTAKQLTPK